MKWFKKFNLWENYSDVKTDTKTELNIPLDVEVKWSDDKRCVCEMNYNDEHVTGYCHKHHTDWV
jgi:hypothetical protein